MLTAPVIFMRASAGRGTQRWVSHASFKDSFGSSGTFNAPHLIVDLVPGELEGTVSTNREGDVGVSSDIP